jgi:integrase
VIVAGAARRTLEEAGNAYVDHLEHVMERKRSTIQDYRVRDQARLGARQRRGLRGPPEEEPLPHQRVRFLQPSELDQLIDAAPEDTLGAVERALYLAAALTGLRQGELLALKWLDIDWSVGRVRVADNFTRGRLDTPKSHEGRSVPMAARLASELEALRQRSRFRTDTDLVFCHPDTGHVLDLSKMRKRFKVALARGGAGDHVPRAAPHLRHADGRGRCPAACDPGVDGPRGR